MSQSRVWPILPLTSLLHPMFDYWNSMEVEFFALLAYNSVHFFDVHTKTFLIQDLLYFLVDFLHWIPYQLTANEYWLSLPIYCMSLEIFSSMRFPNEWFSLKRHHIVLVHVGIRFPHLWFPTLIHLLNIPFTLAFTNGRQMENAWNNWKMIFISNAVIVVFQTRTITIDEIKSKKYHRDTRRDTYRISRCCEYQIQFRCFCLFENNWNIPLTITILILRSTQILAQRLQFPKNNRIHAFYVCSAQKQLFYRQRRSFKVN